MDCMEYQVINSVVSLFDWQKNIVNDWWPSLMYLHSVYIGDIYEVVASVTAF